MKVRYLTLLLFVFILCTGCTAQKLTRQEPVMFASFEDFRSGPAGGVDLVWSTKRISDEASLRATLQKYESLILDQTFVVVDRKTAGTLDEKQMLEIPRQMVHAIESRFGRWFKLVDTPSENTLRLSIALTNTGSSKPFFAEAAGGSLPAGIKISTVTKVVAGDRPKEDRAMAELLVSDARSHEPLIATIDKHFSDKDLGTIIASPVAAKAAITPWVERLWITLAYWNWIQSRTP